MTKKIISLILLFAVSLSSAFAQAAAPAKKHRKIAIQAFSMNYYTLEETVNRIKGLDIDGVECYPNQRISDKFGNAKFDVNMTAEQKAFVKKLFADAKLKMVSFGVKRTSKDADVEKYCRFANEFGIERIITEDPVSRFPVWDKFGKKYGVKMCLHHHAKDSLNQYFDPEVMNKYTRPFDNVMANPDVGHWSRCGINPVDALKLLKGNIGSIHFKDQAEFGNAKNQPVPLGEGALNDKTMLAELDKQGYNGFFVIEYEANYKDNLKDLEKCVKFLREN